MKLKSCKSCGEEKKQEDFYAGHLCCKSCRLAKDKLRREKLKDEIKLYKKEYRLKNYDRFRKKEAENLAKRDKELEREKSKKRYLKTLQDPQKKKKFQERILNWKLQNADKVKEIRKKHRQKSFYYKYANHLRQRINRFFKNRDFSVSELLGCSNEEFKIHLEKQFAPGMTWDNYGVHGWHIDHIVPLSSARNNVERLKELCHYTNLQPLWAEDNRVKSNKMPVQSNEDLER